MKFAISLDSKSEKMASALDNVGRHAKKIRVFQKEIYKITFNQGRPNVRLNSGSNFGNDSFF